MRLPDPVREALTRLEAAGFAAYVVGGAVRDDLRGILPHDFDLCTAALPAETKAVFAGERVVETGLRHGTVTVILHGVPLEITTFRVESGYSDSRHPDGVRFVREIEADLGRRDFTVNAMAFSPVRGLVDPFGGRADIAQRTLRAVGNPETRFREDALRILRGLRIAAETGFTIEEDTGNRVHNRGGHGCRAARARTHAAARGARTTVKRTAAPALRTICRTYPAGIFCGNRDHFAGNHRNAGISAA